MRFDSSDQITFGIDGESDIYYYDVLFDDFNDGKYMGPFIDESI